MRQAALFGALALLLGAAAPAPSPGPLDKAADTPDLMQSAPEAGLPGGGMTYCGPVSASNGLVWLARHGWPALAPADAELAAHPGQLAARLGGRRYLRVTEHAGTSEARMALGLEAYLKDHGVAGATVRFMGFEADVPPRFRAGRGGVDPRWLMEAFAGDAAAVLLVNWYRHDRRTDTYTQYAGHWVTLVGYGRDAAGHPDPLAPIVHDPAPRSGPAPHADHVRLARLTRGRVTTWGAPPFVPALGRWRVGGGMRIKAGADAGLLHGAVVVRMPARP